MLTPAALPCASYTVTDEGSPAARRLHEARGRQKVADCTSLELGPMFELPLGHQAPVESVVRRAIVASRPAPA
jgi:hypothetical protein